MTHRTILVAHSDLNFLADVVPRLSDRGYHVIGPVTTARLALALAATAPATLALVGERLGGVRDGRSLADALRTRWGVPSILVADDWPLPGRA